MKIFCILEEISEASAADGLSWYSIPDSAIVRTDNPVFVPDFDPDMNVYPCLAVRIDKLGKSIAPRFARRYYNEATFVLVARADGMLTELRKAGKSWDKAVAFDRCCMTGVFQPFAMFPEGSEITMSLGADTFTYKLGDMAEAADTAISAVSKIHTLKTGDFVLLPLSQQGLKMRRGENMNASAGNVNLLEIRFK